MLYAKTCSIMSAFEKQFVVSALLAGYERIKDQYEEEKAELADKYEHKLRIVRRDIEKHSADTWEIVETEIKKKFVIRRLCNPLREILRMEHVIDLPSINECEVSIQEVMNKIETDTLTSETMISCDEFITLYVKPTNDNSLYELRVESIYHNDKYFIAKENLLRLLPVL